MYYQSGTAVVLARHGPPPGRTRWSVRRVVAPTTTAAAASAQAWRRPGASTMARPGAQPAAAAARVGSPPAREPTRAAAAAMWEGSPGFPLPVLTWEGSPGFPPPLQRHEALPMGWELLASKAGEPYFYNSYTGESTRERPAAATAQQQLEALQEEQLELLEALSERPDDVRVPVPLGPSGEKGWWAVSPRWLCADCRVVYVAVVAALPSTATGCGPQYGRPVADVAQSGRGGLGQQPRSGTQ
jgi:hypothetical protein